MTVLSDRPAGAADNNPADVSGSVRREADDRESISISHRGQADGQENRRRNARGGIVRRIDAVPPVHNNCGVHPRFRSTASNAAA